MNKSINSMKTIVSSSIANTWPENGQIILLGSWCRVGQNRNAKGITNILTIPYHWDNQKKFDNDCEIIDSLIEEYLLLISDKLNEIHNTHYSVRYWRILVGWWLTSFIQILYDRWSNAIDAAQKYPDAEIIKIQRTGDNSKPRSSGETVWRAANDDSWNEEIVSKIFSNFTSIKIRTEVNDETTKLNYPYDRVNTSRGLFTKKLNLMIFHKVSKSRSNIVSLESMYLKRIDKLKLYVLLKSFPIHFIPWNMSESKIIPLSKKLIISSTNKTEFKKVLEKLLPEYFPTCYLEEFKFHEKMSYKVRRYFSPSKIVTANDFADNDAWKFWAANCVENGSKLIIAQHGGTYGSAHYLSTQNYEIKISDRYLTWGWKDISNSKVYPTSALKLLGMREIQVNPQGNCLLVTLALPQRSYHLGSWPLGPQIEKYLDDQFVFVSKLDENVRKKLKVKPFPIDYGWRQEIRWKQFDSNVDINIEGKTMDNLMKETKLFIATYNSTTFLESFRRNIPTVIFWDKNQWRLNSNAEPFYELLKSAKILFDDPEEAAIHVNNIWDDTYGWWNSNNIKEAVRIFSQEFAFISEAPLKCLAKAIKNL
jgi:putative transferase (TIGR04331 family)